MRQVVQINGLAGGLLCVIRGRKRRLKVPCGRPAAIAPFMVCRCKLCRPGGAHGVLDTAGKRLDKIPAAVRDGKLAFTATVKGSAGARMLYEVVRVAGAR